MSKSSDSNTTRKEAFTKAKAMVRNMNEREMKAFFLKAEDAQRAKREIEPYLIDSTLEEIEEESNFMTEIMADSYAYHDTGNIAKPHNLPNEVYYQYLSPFFLHPVLEESTQLVTEVSYNGMPDNTVWCLTLKVKKRDAESVLTKLHECGAERILEKKRN